MTNGVCLAICLRHTAGRIAGLLAILPFAIPLSAEAALSIEVAGNHLVNGSGQTVHLIGFNRQSAEYMCVSTNVTFDDNVSGQAHDQAEITAMKSWGAAVNIVRIPLNEDCWLGLNGLPSGRLASAYQTDIINYVNLLHANGLYAELDLHWNAPGTTKATGQTNMADYDHSIAFWQSVATAFQNDQAVIFDLYNEPHDVTWQCWNTGGPECTSPGWRTAGMAEMIAGIRNAEGTGWHHPVTVAGLGWSNDVSGWLANRPADSASQEIAGIHSYNDGAGGSGGCPASNGGVFNENNCATTIFGGIKSAGYPIFVNELGDLAAGGCTYSTYLNSLVNWFDTNGDGYEPWSWGSYGCGNPSLLNSNGSPVSTYGTGMQAHMLSLPALPPPPTDTTP